MIHEFDTFAEAIAAGYERKGKQDKDTSGPQSFGYSYQNQEGRKTVTVWFRKEKNQMGQDGCFLPMYPPKDQ